MSRLFLLDEDGDRMELNGRPYDYDDEDFERVLLDREERDLEDAEYFDWFRENQ